MHPGIGSGDPKAIRTPTPPPSFLFSVLKLIEVKQFKGRGKKKKPLRLNKERERDYELLWVLVLKKIPRLWHGHLENGSVPIYSC